MTFLSNYNTYTINASIPHSIRKWPNKSTVFRNFGKHSNFTGVQIIEMPINIQFFTKFRIYSLLYWDWVLHKWTIENNLGTFTNVL